MSASAHQLTPGGDVIKESIGAFPRLVLAEGDYRVIARNDSRTFQRDFKVNHRRRRRSRSFDAVDLQVFWPGKL